MRERPSVFINAVHHARELTTISQITYTMMALLHGYEHHVEEYVELMRNAALIFLPMVNPDGVATIDDLYTQNGSLKYIRKNRNIYDKQKRCPLDG
mmetsp:Transcript_36381/g.44436  ORF Transcript_36381/g.44436 Transcript_36381/m.44436 type:complete len:96 (+) Transcript_36381:346-633(+)